MRLVSALPETWLVHLIRMAEDDPEMTLVRLAKEEEGVGISAGAHLAGVKSAMLMQNHGFLASVNGIVSCAQLYRIPLLMLISHRGEFGERDPWQTEGGGVTEHVLDALRIPHDVARLARPRGAPHPQGADARPLGEPPRRAAALPRPDVGGSMKRRDAMEAIYARSRSVRRRDDHGRGGRRAAVDRAQPNFFYLQHAMGLASSMGLGIALSRPELHGGRVRRRRVGPHESRRPHDARPLSAAESRARRVRQREPAVGRRLSDGDVHRQRHRRRSPRRRAFRARRPCATIDEFTSEFAEALAAHELTTIVAKVEAVGPSGYVTDLALLENRYQFQRHLRSRQTRNASN